jgi:hypothetical protein
LEEALTSQKRGRVLEKETLTYFVSSSFREGETSSGWSRTLETASNVTFLNVPDLQPFTTYMFRVAARNKLGYSKPSKESYPTMTHREREYLKF